MKKSVITSNLPKKGTPFLSAGYVFAPYIPLNFTNLKGQKRTRRTEVGIIIEVFHKIGKLIFQNEVMVRFEPSSKKQNITNNMAILQPGDLVKLKPDPSKNDKSITGYKINDLEHFNRVVNQPEKFVTVTNTHISGLKIPPIDVTFDTVQSEQSGLYLGFINVEDYGQLSLYYSILLGQSIYLFKEELVALELGKRNIKTI